MKKTAVLMSTYNGGKFLKEQIESILAQEGTEVTLYVRDDGSTDETRELLMRYMEQHGIIVTFGQNAGVGNSFMQLLYSVPEDYDYYAFSDQDDIWLPDKLSAAQAKLGKVSGPALYASNQMLTDANGRETGLRYAENPGTSVQQILHNNKLAGCTFVWNEAMQKLYREKKRRPDPELLKVRIHDVWTAMAAAVAGTVIYDPEAHILYRQHEANVVGAKESGFTDVAKMWKKKLADKSLRRGRSRLCREICIRYRDRLGDHRDLLRTFAWYTRDVRLKKRLMADGSQARYSGESKAAWRAKVMMNLV